MGFPQVTPSGRFLDRSIYADTLTADLNDPFGPCSVYAFEFTNQDVSAPAYFKVYDGIRATYVSRPVLAVMIPSPVGPATEVRRTVSIAGGLTFETGVTIRVTNDAMKHTASDGIYGDAQITIFAKPL